MPFCGYDIGDYFAHWLSIGGRAGASNEIEPIRAFYVSLGDSLPVELQQQLDALERRLS